MYHHLSQVEENNVTKPKITLYDHVKPLKKKLINMREDSLFGENDIDGYLLGLSDNELTRDDVFEVSNYYVTQRCNNLYNVDHEWKCSH